jgi:alkaline phosphatase
MDVLKEFAAPVAQIVSAVAVALGYLLLIKNQRKMIRERREVHTAGGRPLVVVTADHSHLPEMYVVVQNFTEAPAKDITFEFSAPIESSDGHVLSDLPYFKDGLPFLAPQGQITCYWDSMPSLASLLKDKGLENGIAVTTRYKDLAEETYQTQWRLNPLLYEGARIQDSKGMNDLVNAVEKISKDDEDVGGQNNGHQGATRRSSEVGQGKAH